MARTKSKSQRALASSVFRDARILLGALDQESFKEVRVSGVGSEGGHGDVLSILDNVSIRCPVIVYERH